jgi:hypothetical protein
MGMSKAQMAKRLIELGDKRAFNTLRKLPADVLAGLLEGRGGENIPTVITPTQPVEDVITSTQEVKSSVPAVELVDTSSAAAFVEPTLVTETPIYVPTDAEIMMCRIPVSLYPYEDAQLPAPTWRERLSNVVVLAALCGAATLLAATWPVLDALFGQ